MVSLAKRLEGRPFHLVATHCQRDTKENVVQYIQGKGLAADTPNVTVSSFGGHPKVKGNGYVPYYMVFDHTGKLVREHMCGDYHGGDGLGMIEWVENALKDAPGIWLGEQPFEKVATLAKKVSSGKKLGATIKAIETKLEIATDAATKAELERLHGAVAQHRDRRIERALSLQASRPSGVKSALDKLKKDFAGSSLVDRVQETLDETSKSAQLRQAIQAEKSFESIRKSLAKKKSCKTCKRSGSKKIRLGCAQCRAQNQTAISKAQKKLDALLQEHGDLPFAATIRDYAKQLGD